MTLATTLLAAALVMPSMPPPEYDDCEVVTNCVFDTSRGDAKMFALKIEALRSYLAVTRTATASFRGRKRRCPSATIAASGRS